MRGLIRTTGRPRRARLTAVMRGTFYFRPLALALAFTLLRIPLLGPIGGAQPAFAAADPCAPSADRILQDICPEGVPETTLINFEHEIVDAWLTAHKMPLSDASLIYEHGRSDLRSVIRAAMLGRILGIIAKSQPERTAEEQYIFEWFRRLVQDKEVGLYQYAVDERDRWENDPCHWKPDPDIANAYGLHYTGGVACSGGLGSLFSTQAQVPQKSYFLTAGLKESYGSKIAETPGGSQVLMQTSEDLLPAIGVSVIGAAAAALGTAVLVTVAWGTIFGAAVGVAKIVAAVSIGVVAGAAAIVFFAVIVGFIAAFEFSAEQQTLNQLGELDTDLANAQSRFVSLSTLAGTQEGMSKLTMAFTEATLPEFSSTSTLPTHGSDDALFYVGHGGAPPSTTTAVLTYQDWDGDIWTATPYRGFFVQQGTKNGNPVTSLSPILRILDPSTGEKLTADLVGTNFQVTRAEPREDQEICPANPFTGVSESSIIVCSAYVVSQIDLRDENGDQETVTLASLPSFTSPPTTTFSQDVAKTFDVTAAGSPPPSIVPVGSLPAGFTFASAGDTGVLHLIYDGTTPVGVSEHNVTFRATNPRGVATQDFTIKTRIDLEFTSSDSTNFVGGKVGSFLVTTSGAPTPGITSNCSAGASGLTLTDNGDGTATLSGIPNGPAGTYFVCTIQASNASQTISQQFTLGVVAPPLAQVSSASSTTFFAGAPNSFDIVTHGAETPVTINFPCPSGSDIIVPPDWLSLQDHGDGTATLSGTPPAGTEGPFSFFLRVHTLGESISLIICGLNEVSPNFTINVSNVPRFLSPNRIQFGPPPSTGTTFSVVTNQASGLVSLQGTLPADLSFQPDASHGSATIQGFPAVGTGGVYPLVLSMTNGAGTGFQNLRLLVKEAPTFGGARDSAVFYIGTDNSLPVPTTGFPKAPELIGNENPVQLAMHIDVSGALPPGVSFTDSNQLDIPTGTGLFTGIPDPGSEGVYPLTLTADNGVPPAATLDFTLYVVKAGDVNHDGIADKRDLDLIRMSLGKTLADPGYDPSLDTNHDGIIDEQDFNFVKDACGDPDGDGACESYTEDRDHDGIPDAEDYDPTGYLYDVHTGKILTGGKVTVSPAPASMPYDGSGGFYQFLVAPGETVYTLTVQPPRGCRFACSRLDPPPLDPNGMSVVLGSSEVDNTGLLASAQCSDNPHALTLQLGETGDEVLLNNIALDCSPSQAPLLDPRGILLALLALLGIAALGFRRRLGTRDETRQRESTR